MNKVYQSIKKFVVQKYNFLINVDDPNNVKLQIRLVQKSFQVACVVLLATMIPITKKFLSTKRRDSLFDKTYA